MKRKCGIALVSMILFILLCNGVCAEDENATSISEYEDYFDLGDDEDFMVEMHYETGDMFYHIIAKWRTYTLRNKDSPEPDLVYVSFLPVPELSNNFHIFVEGLGKEIEPIVITTQEELVNAKESINEQLKNNKQLIEFIMKYTGDSEEQVRSRVVLSEDEIKEMSKDLERYWLCVIIYPEYLYEEEEFILRIDFDTELHESQRNKFYMNWLLWRFEIGIKNFEHVYFVLPWNAYPWWYDMANDSFKVRGRNVLLWNVEESEEIYILATFGTFEERLHWENHVNNVENFIYVIMGIFLTIMLAIFFANYFERYKWLKYITLAIVLTIFKTLFTIRIDNFDLEEIPLETCLGGECLIDKIDTISKILGWTRIVLILCAIFLIFRFFRGRREEPEEITEQREEIEEDGNGEEEEKPKGDNDGKGKKEEDQKPEEKIQNQGAKEKTKIIETKKESKKCQKRKGKIKSDTL